MEKNLNLFLFENKKHIFTVGTRTIQDNIKKVGTLCTCMHAMNPSIIFMEWKLNESTEEQVMNLLKNLEGFELY